MKLLSFFYGILILIVSPILSGCNTNTPKNEISDLNKIDTCIAVKNWRLIGPFKYIDTGKTGESVSFKMSGIDTADYNFISRFLLNDSQSHLQNAAIYNGHKLKDTCYTQTKDYVDLAEAFALKQKFRCYCLATIYSKTEQNLAVLTGITNGIKIWVNGKFCLSAHSKNITKDEFAGFAHFHKGNNLVIVQVENDSEAMGFHFDLSSLNFVRKYKLGINYNSICKDYIIKTGDVLMAKINYPEVLNYTNKINCYIYNHLGEQVYKQTVAQGNSCKIPLKSLKHGAYSLQLAVGPDNFRQCFVYGDEKHLVDSLNLTLQNAAKTDSQKIIVKTLIDRFNYLEDFGLKNGYDDVLNRKISLTVWELQSLGSYKISYKNRPGLHLGAFRSAVDETINNYMVYIPYSYKADKKIPLVVIMPWVAKQNPFIESWHVAFQDHIEYLEQLAEKYHFGILWESSRIYEKYNLNPIVTKTTFEAFNNVCGNYNIDRNKIYLYGTCSGGLQCLLLANRYPSVFAALGVEGPEINYTECENHKCDFPQQWVKQNSIVNTAENYFNIPLLILSSKNDWHASDSTIIYSVINKVKAVKGKAYFDNMNNPTRDFYNKMVPDNYVADKIFNFFSNKSLKTPSNISFETYQLKYGSCYWITLNGINTGSKATLKASVKSDTILINTNNVNSFNIDLAKIGCFLNTARPTIVLNNHIAKNYMIKSNQATLVIDNSKNTFTAKQDNIEGPVNDVFSGRFILIKGTANNKSKLDVAGKLFTDSWKYNFFGDCLVKEDQNLNINDITNSNLILLGDMLPGTLAYSILSKLPVHKSAGSIIIANKVFSGTALNYSLVYPNPLNNKRYVLIINTNSKSFLAEQLENLPLKGWYDYQVWNYNSEDEIAHGYFDKNWQLIE
jgi:hypothetical protein